MGVHRVQVVSERGPGYPDGLGQLTLVAGTTDLQVEQDEPDREGASRLRQRGVEGALHRAGRLGQAQADRDGERFRHTRQSSITHRCRIV
jgi:hypothetical protein